MRKNGPTNRTNNLNPDIGQSQPWLNFAPQQKGNGYRGIEMRSGNRTEDGDQNDENGTCWNCIAKQGNGHVPRRQIFGHDSRTDDSGQQEHCSKPFAGKGAVKIIHDQSISPISASAACNEVSFKSLRASKLSIRQHI